MYLSTSLKSFNVSFQFGFARAVNETVDAVDESEKLEPNWDGETAILDDF